MSKKIIVCDVDGPLSGCDEELISLVKPNITLEDLENNKDWDIFKLFNSSELMHAHEVFRNPEFWTNLSPKESALYQINEARKEGNEILFCTSPWESCLGWDQIRRDWLRKHFDAKGRDDVIITAAKQYIYGDVFIDDRPINVISWGKRWRKDRAIFYETPQNKNDPNSLELKNRIKIIDNRWKFIKNV